MLKNLTLVIAFGALLGAALVWWTSPRTGGGVTLLVVGCILLCMIVASLYAAFARRVGEPTSRGAEPHA